MAGVISIGGLATGLDTNSIVDQLVKLERRPVALLERELAAVEATQASIASLGGKLAALRGAAAALDSVAEVLVGKASSSDEAVLAAAAGEGASRGTLTLTVSRLAQGSVAGATVGVASAASTVAAGAGTLRFQVGTGTVQSVALSATTTLEELATAINDLDAGVTASAVNLGTAASPDYRLSIVSQATGASSTITVLQDDTTLALQTTQAGENAEFTVGGFSGTFERETNTFADVLAGVTLNLKAPGAATVVVNDDADAIVAKVDALVAAFNDVVRFVADESQVTREGAEGEEQVRLGSLAANATVRRLVDRLHETFSAPLAGATGKFPNLASLGLATQRDGTIAFDQTKLRAALGEDAAGVAAVLAGTDGSDGVAGALADLVADVTGTGGALAVDTNGFDERVQLLQDQIDAGQRRVDQFEQTLIEQFTALESLVSGLQSQGDFLLAALRGL